MKTFLFFIFMIFFVLKSYAQFFKEISCLPMSRPELIHKQVKKRGGLNITKSNLMLFTHSDMFKKRLLELNSLDSIFKNLDDNFELIYLHKGKAQTIGKFPTCDPDYFYRSGGGEIQLNIGEPTKNVFFIGGYYHLCLRDSVKDILKSLKRSGRNSNINFIFVIDAVIGDTIGVPKNYIHFSGPSIDLLSLPMEQFRSRNYISHSFEGLSIDERFTLKAHWLFSNSEYYSWTIRKALKRNSKLEINAYYIRAKEIGNFL